jgi:hypothetical protein
MFVHKHSCVRISGVFWCREGRQEGSNRARKPMKILKCSLKRYHPLAPLLCVLGHLCSESGTPIHLTAGSLTHWLPNGLGQ